MPKEKNKNKKISQPKRVRYRTEERWKTNAIKHLKKHIEKHKDDKQAKRKLEEYEENKRKDRVRRKASTVQR